MDKNNKEIENELEKIIVVSSRKCDKLVSYFLLVLS